MMGIRELSCWPCEAYRERDKRGRFKVQAGVGGPGVATKGNTGGSDLPPTPS
jgi:hypothetical protein